VADTLGEEEVVWLTALWFEGRMFNDGDGGSAAVAAFAALGWWLDCLREAARGRGDGGMELRSGILTMAAERGTVTQLSIAQPRLEAVVAGVRSDGKQTDANRHKVPKCVEAILDGAKRSGWHANHGVREMQVTKPPRFDAAAYKEARFGGQVVGGSEVLLLRPGKFQEEGATRGIQMPSRERGLYRATGTKVKPSVL
jgi:hypothetical protein